MIFVDATCPLVSKVHRGSPAPCSRTAAEIVLIGHAGHPEVIGTMGQLPPGAITLLEDNGRRRSALCRAIRAKLSFVTQTTLSVDDTAEMVAHAAAALPGIAAPHKEDICYATTNRQDAGEGDGRALQTLVLVIGSPNSLELRALGGSRQTRRRTRCAAGGFCG